MLKFIENITKNMSRQQLLILIVVLVAVGGYGAYMLSNCWNKPTSNNPLAYNEQFIGNKKPEFIMFYVDWCGYCKQTKPVFKKFMDSNRRDNIDIKMLNAEQEGESLAKQYNVEGYPTIILVRNGNHEVCNSERTPEAWNAWLDNKLA